MVKPWDTATIGDFLDFKNGLNKGKEFLDMARLLSTIQMCIESAALRKAMCVVKLTLLVTKFIDSMREK